MVSEEHRCVTVECGRAERALDLRWCNEMGEQLQERKKKANIYFCFLKKIVFCMCGDGKGRNGVTAGCTSRVSFVWDVCGGNPRGLLRLF